MYESLSSFFTTGPFMPHGHCYLWRPDMLLLHVGSDVLIAASYFSIPLVLISMVRGRRDLDFNWTFILFALFIFACGMTHVLRIVTTWIPAYGVEGLVKFLTAVASVGTAVVLWPLLPKVIALPTHQALRELASSLEAQVDERTRELRRTSEALERRQESLSLALSAGRMGSFDWDLATGGLRWSEGHFTLCGLEPGSRTPDHQLWVQTVHAPDRDRMTRAVERAKREGSELHEEYRTIWPDGTVHWLEARARVEVDPRGEAVRMVGVIIDIDRRKDDEVALKEARERLDLALESAGMVFYECDATSRTVKRSDTNRSLFGPGELGTTLDDFLLRIHPEDLPRAKATQAEASARGGRYQVDFRLQRDDGRYVWVEDHGRVMLGDDGSPRGTIGVAMDISVRKASEITLRENEKSLQIALRSRDEFLGTLSHELRTPMNVILGWLEMIRLGGVETASLPRVLDTLERNAKVQIQLINDLLDVSRIINGQMSLNARHVDLADVVRQGLAATELAAAQKGLALVFDVAVPAPRVVGDPDRLAQVVWNLASNAIKFTPRGGRVDVLLRAVDSNVVMEVRDSGVGIDPAFLPYVFERFRQEDASRSRHTGGLGLGLAIVRHIVEMHGGTVSVESGGRDRGSAFRVVLPVRALRADDLPRPEPSRASDTYARPSPAEKGTALRGRTVLVVDDVEDALELVRSFLVDSGAVVYVASSAAEAFAFVKRVEFDAILCDVGMPEEDGLSFLRRLRAWEREHGRKATPAVALTAYARLEDATDALAAGFDHHLAKPVLPSRLISVIESMVRKAEPTSADEPA